MKFNKLDLRSLRNDEHFQFHTEFRDAVNRNGAGNMSVADQFDAYIALYGEEDEALKKIFKSALTAEIQTADAYRDRIFSGMCDVNRAALKHFREDVQQAATRLKIVLDTYGNLAIKPLNEQTSGVYNLLQDLNARIDDAEKAGIAEWMTELQTANDAFSQLVKDRYDETTARTDIVLKEARAKLDAQYRLITERIEAIVVINGTAGYGEFIRYMNTVIAKYAAILAKRTKKKV